MLFNRIVLKTTLVLLIVASMFSPQEEGGASSCKDKMQILHLSLWKYFPCRLCDKKDSNTIVHVYLRKQCYVSICLLYFPSFMSTL